MGDVPLWDVSIEWTALEQTAHVIDFRHIDVIEWAAIAVLLRMNPDELT